jgi:hypothetical protein
MKTRRALFRLTLLTLLLPLAGCLEHDQPRATAEHLAIKNRVAIVVLADAAPRVDTIALQPTRSTHARATLGGWDVRAALQPYLAERLRGKGLTVVPLDYDPAEFAAVYASSTAYPDSQRISAALRARAAQAQADLLVVIYRQIERDFIGESVENLVGYGLVRHEGREPQAYAAVGLEAIAIDSGAVIARADGLKAVPLAADAWREAYATDDTVAIEGTGVPAVTAALTAALQGAALGAAQEAGLSH